MKILTGTIHELPDTLIEVLKNNDTLRDTWNLLTPLARNEWICYMSIPKKEETKTSRLFRLQEDILSGKKRPCCWPSCPHHRPDAQKWF